MIDRLAWTILLLLPLGASAQIIITGSRPIAPAPRPAGVIPTPVLPMAGQPFSTRTASQFPVSGVNISPWGLFTGYVPYYWPAWGSSSFSTRTDVVFPVPTPAPAPVSASLSVLPLPMAVSKTAKLILLVPNGAEVLVSGIKQDTKFRPIIVESPELKLGQSYLFDVKVTWKEGERTEERTRQLQVEAGDEKSLTYFGNR